MKKLVLTLAFGVFAVVAAQAQCSPSCCKKSTASAKTTETTQATTTTKVASAKTTTVTASANQTVATTERKRKNRKQ
jgi:hypothetical protein